MEDTDGANGVERLDLNPLQTTIWRSESTAGAIYRAEMRVACQKRLAASAAAALEVRSFEGDLLERLVR